MTFLPAENPRAALTAAGIPIDPPPARLAITAVAGRDSVAAVVAAVEAEGFSAVLPTSVATGTEYGDETAPNQSVALMRELLAGRADVLPLVRIGSPSLWSALNGAFAATIQQRYGSGSPCLACHLYVHLVRVPLSWALGSVPVVTGERDTHDGRIKLSQTAASIDAETRVLNRAGVRLLTPVRGLSSAGVDQLVRGRWPGRSAELACVHSGNYYNLDGAVCYDPEGYARYLTEFFEPAGDAVLREWRRDPTPDYRAIVRQVLER